MMPLLKDFLNESNWKYQVLFENHLPNVVISSVHMDNEWFSELSSVNTVVAGQMGIIRFFDFIKLSQEQNGHLLPEVFLILADGTEEKEWKNTCFHQQHPECTCVLLLSKIEMAECYQLCLNLLTNEHDFVQSLVQQHLPNLLTLMNKDASIGEIEAYANKILGNPMIITDESYKVVTYSKNIQVHDEIWSTIVDNTYCPANLVNMTNQNRFWKRLSKSERPLFVDSDEFAPYMRRAVAEIKLNNKTKGYIALLEANKTITKLDLEVLHFVSELIATKLKEKDAVKKAIGLMESELISDLLNGKMDNELMAQNRVQSVGWRLMKQYFVLCVKATKQTMKSKMDKLTSQLLSYYPFSAGILVGEQGFFIIGFDGKEKANRQYMKNMERIMADMNTIGFMGMPVPSLIEIGKSYKQAKQSLQIIQLMKEKPGEAFYCYSEMAAYDLLLKLQQLGEQSLPISPSILALLKMDQQEGTDYIQTLHYFFNHNQNVADTADAMFLHRNTINYRLNKIRHIIDEDFDHSSIRLHMNLTLKMLDLGLI